MLSVDRIENETAVCIDDGGRQINVPLAEIKGRVREGDLLKKEKNGYVIDDAATRQARAEMKALFDKLKE